MDQTASYLLAEVRRAEFDLAEAKRKLGSANAKLDDFRRRCRHEFSETKYDPIVTPGGYSPGDPPGTMGVDRQLPMSWGPTEEARWSRTCSKCGLVEHTTRTTSVPKPLW